MAGFTKEHCLALFEAFAGNGASGAPEWLKARRAEAMATFGDRGFPSTREEEWRFTSVKPVLDHAFVLGKAPATVDPTMARRFEIGDGARVVFVNGQFNAGLSDVSGLPDGVYAGPLSEAWRDRSELLEPHFGRHAPPALHGFAALNAAFASEGALIHVPRNVRVEREIQVLYLTVTGEGAIMTVPRTLAVVEEGASVRVIETYGGEGGGPVLTSAVTEVVVGDNAEADWYRVQREGRGTYHIGATHSTQGRDSRYSLIALPFGGTLSRHDVRMVMDGEGGEGTLNGLYVMGGTQHVDHQTVIEHAKPHCNSHEYFNGILDERAHAVFNGRIIVQPGAQKTDSKQTNNNLLLSETARADSQPQLEIYADDVRCTHGATAGPLDENALFYLQSRGVDAETARDMLTYGFGFEILEGIKAPSVRKAMETLVRERLNRALHPA